MLPWSRGRCLVWDFTCPDTTAASHLNRAAVGAGVGASDAEEKRAKYASLSSMFEFVPIAVETFRCYRRGGSELYGKRWSGYLSCDIGATLL